MHYVIIELLHALCYHGGAGPRATACIVIIELLHALCYHGGAGPRATACIMLSWRGRAKSYCMHYVIIEGQGQELLHALCHHRGAGPRVTACIMSS